MVKTSLKIYIIYNFQNKKPPQDFSLRRIYFYTRGTTQIAVSSATQSQSTLMPLRSNHGKRLLEIFFGAFSSEVIGRLEAIILIHTKHQFSAIIYFLTVFVIAFYIFLDYIPMLFICQ